MSNVKFMEKIDRRKFLEGAGLAAGGVMVSSCAAMGVGMNQLGMPTLLLSPAMMMRKLSPHFPVTKEYQGVAELQFADPVLSTLPDQEKIRVGMTTLGGIKGIGRQAGGRCQMACGLRYDPGTKGVFLTDAVLENFELSGVSSKWTNGLRSVANLVGKEYLERYPVYTLPSKLGVGFIKSMNVQSNGVLLSFGV